jgi:DNA-binding MarR family transcriptional regulator
MVKSFRFGNIPSRKDFSMSTEKIADQFLELIQRYICLRPKLILPEHAIQLRKKMEGLKNKVAEAGGNPEDHAFLFRILILLAQNAAPLKMSDLSTELNVPVSTATRIVDWLVRGELVERVNDPNDRRIVRVSLSEGGRESYELVMTYNKQRVARLLKDFTAEEQAQLLNLMNKLFNSLMSEK